MMRYESGNLTLRLMKCFPPIVSYHIFMDNYFTSFCMLTHFGVNNIQVTSVHNENRVSKCTIIEDKQLQEKGTWPL